MMTERASIEGLRKLHRGEAPPVSAQMALGSLSMIEFSDFSLVRLPAPDPVKVEKGVHATFRENLGGVRYV